MHKYKDLLNNIGILTISNLGTKILSFLLIPLYTKILTTGEYGVFDNYTTVVSLFAPVLTICIANGVMRFCLDEKVDNREVFAIGISRELSGVVLFSIFVYINVLFKIIPILTEFPIYLILMYISSRLYIFLTLFCRGIDKIYEVAIAGAINSFVFLILNVLFLTKLKLGLSGYFWANIIANFLPAIYIAVKTGAFRLIKIRCDKRLKMEMVSYCTPMIFSELGWWINNASDRFIVTLICGLSANGIYSIAYKIPSILNIFQNIFNQAWTLTAVKENGVDRSEFYSNIYSVYNSGMVIACSFFIVCDKLLAKLLFSNEFFMAWKFAPFLMISTVFGALIGLLEGIFIAEKKSKIIAITTCIGAIVNTFFNFLLVYFWGPMGAAISTLLAYFVVWLSRLYYSSRIISLNIKIYRDCTLYLLLTVQATILLLDMSKKITYITQFLFLFIIISLCKKEISTITHMCLTRFVHKK